MRMPSKNAEYYETKDWQEDTLGLEIIWNKITIQLITVLPGLPASRHPLVVPE